MTGAKENNVKGAAATSRTMTDQAERADGWRLPRRLLAGPKVLLSGLGVTARLRLGLFMLLAPPPALILYLLESGTVTDPVQLVALWLALFLVLLKPLSAGLARFVVLGEIADLNAFCAALRRGEYARRLPLPPQGDDEHALLVLKRDLNWMAHNIETREAWLRTRLDETHQRKRLFEDLSRTDALTGLFNRRHFDAVLPERIGQALAGGHDLTLLLIDCDAFKSVNDRFGHPAGDAVLACLGRVLRESVREGLDLAFRLGGDEFAVILPNQDRQAARRVARRARLRFATTNPHGATASVGLASLDPALDAGSPAPSLLARCDAALYRAKAAGGNGEAVADGPMSPSIENEN
jgi:diguanylate cyclase (GGDEF)-like protein